MPDQILGPLLMNAQVHLEKYNKAHIFLYLF